MLKQQINKLTVAVTLFSSDFRNSVSEIFPEAKLVVTVSVYAIVTGRMQLVSEKLSWGVSKALDVTVFTSSMGCSPNSRPFRELL